MFCRSFSMPFLFMRCRPMRRHRFGERGSNQDFHSLRLRAIAPATDVRHQKKWPPVCGDLEANKDAVSSIFKPVKAEALARIHLSLNKVNARAHDNWLRCRQTSAIQNVSEALDLKDLETQMTFRRAAACSVDDDNERKWDLYKSVFNGRSYILVQQSHDLAGVNQQHCIGT